MNARQQFQLFPPIEPYRTGMLPVDALHTLYWEETGNPDGLPVVYLHGMRLFYPQAHERFTAWIPEQERGDLIAAYAKRLFGDAPAVRMEVARRWYRYSEDCALLRHDPQAVEQALQQHGAVYSTARLHVHYFRLQMFLEPGQLIDGMDRIAHLPALLVQGGHDVITPPQAAYRLHRAWPGSVLHVVPDAGHAPSEAGTRARLVEALEQFRQEGKFH